MRGVFFCLKSGKWGGCEKEDHSSTQGALCTVSVFFTFYLFGSVYAPPLPMGLGYMVGLCSGLSC